MRKRFDILDILTLTIVSSVLMAAAWVNVGPTGGTIQDTTLTPARDYGDDPATPSDGVALYATDTNGRNDALLLIDDNGDTATLNGSALSFSSLGTIYFGADDESASESLSWSGAVFTLSDDLNAADLRAISGLVRGRDGLSIGVTDPELYTLLFSQERTAEPTDPAANDMSQYVLVEATDDHGSSPAMVLAHDDEGSTTGIFQGGKIWAPGTAYLNGGVRLGSGDTKIKDGFSSASFALSATSVTLTLDWAYDAARDTITYAVYNDAPDTKNAYQGHANDWLKLEGGTLAECGLSSETSSFALRVDVHMIRRK